MLFIRKETLELSNVKYNYNSEYNKSTFYSKYVKRMIDIILALFLLVLTLPILILATIAIKLDSKGSVFFKQPRIGKYGHQIMIYKLRTMDTKTHDEKGKKIRDRDRVTKPGKVIRKLSVDEIPQLFNILKGDMSFIGPRPLLVRYFPYYTNEEVQRHNVLPGITGIAQVKGRSFLQWEKRFEYDLEYVKTISFFTDLKIVLATIKAVFTGAGTSAVRPEGLVDFDEHRKFIKVR